MRPVLEQSARSDDGSDVSAVRMGRDGGGLGRDAHCRAWVSFEGLRPAMAMEVRGEEGLLRNLSASRRTYFPVKPEAPRMMRSKRSPPLGLGFTWSGSISGGCREEEFRVVFR